MTDDDLDQLERELDDDASDDGWRAFPTKIRSTENPHELILDADTSTEGAVETVAAFCIMFGLASGIEWLDERRFSLGIPLGLLVLGILIFCLRSKLDDHYVVDLRDKRLLFHRSFFSHSRRSEICRFNGLAGVVVHPKRESSKSGTWWEYGVSLLRHDARLIQVLSPHRVEHKDVHFDAAALAELLGLPLYSGEPEQGLKVRAGALRPEVEYRPYLFDAKVSAKSVLIALLLIIGVPLLALACLFAYDMR